ncbi:MAG TPA: anti-sigma factor [Dokdonella sp.]|uniref:anti-sigma factor n=1 Tax=Dokdonella sp. TaxID=2291710 RepID=UPI002D80547A|nr:anti-sigma factor [Dokdonella sp.]HET9034346.1 anti-sigma factor [Dokdonella sp.]
MNTLDNQINPPPGDMAAEYVLGVLDASERRVAQARIASDPGFSREIAFWESRFMPMLGEIAAVPVPEYVWARIHSALNLPTRKRTETPSRSGLWESLAFWRWLASGAFVAAAACAIVLLNPRQPLAPTVSPPMVSTLADDNGVPGFVAIVDRDKANMTITPLAAAPTDGRAQELWLIPEGQAPVSLGLLDAKRAQIIRIPDQMLADIRAGALFAVTLESAEGAPHAAPAGPIIAKGGVALL